MKIVQSKFKLNDNGNELMTMEIFRLEVDVCVYVADQLDGLVDVDEVEEVRLMR